MFSRLDYIELDGSRLPLPEKRWCGVEFKDDRYYLNSTEREARRLIHELSCSEQCHVLDIGCGQGRLAIGLKRLMPTVSYLGLDVDVDSIRWCKRNLQQDSLNFDFVHLNVRNERYNPTGIPLIEGFQFPVERGSIDICYLYSVFSHTTEADMKLYLDACYAALKPTGRMFFTTFVETDVAPCTINPENHRVVCSGPLHVVQFDRKHLNQLLKNSKFSVSSFVHGEESDGQSAVYVVKK